MHLKEKNHLLEENNVYILSREDRWFERGIKNPSVKLERSSLNRGGGLRHQLSPVLSSLLRHINNHSHLSSSSPRNPHEGWSGQRYSRILNDTSRWGCESSLVSRFHYDYPVNDSIRLDSTMHHVYCTWLCFHQRVQEVRHELTFNFMCSEKTQMSQKLEPQVYVMLFIH